MSPFPTFKQATAPGTGPITRRLVPFVPKQPDNHADNCWRCPHKWHGLRCDTNSCGCPAAWVDPDVLARLGGARS